jgi:hypothetical protein
MPDIDDMWDDDEDMAMYGGFLSRIKPRPPGRNPIAGHCPFCGKGIRAVDGNIETSMVAHVKAKGCDRLTHPTNGGL